MTTKEMNISIHNRFDIEVIDAKTGLVKQTAEALNVICNQLYTYLLTQNSYPRYYAYGKSIQYGSGSGTPAVTDTALFTYIGGKDVTEIGYYNDVANKVMSRRVQIVLGTADAVGQTLTEVGLAYDTTTGHITTHAVLQDMNGNAISIAKTDTDIINIYATVFVHYDKGQNDGYIIDPIADQYCRIPRWALGAGIDRDSLGIRLDKATPFITSGVSGDHMNYNFDTSLKKATFTYRSDVSNDNINGIGAIFMAGISIFQKDNFTIQGEAAGTGDGTTTKFKTKFDYPRNATVYINGVAQQSGVTVKKLPVTTFTPSNRSMISSHLIALDINSTNSDLIREQRKNANVIDTNSGGMEASLYYNPMWSEGEGVLKITTRQNWGVNYEISNDLVNWTSKSGTGELNAAERASKYFKIHGGGNSQNERINAPTESQDGYNIIFDTAPADGDVITIDYTTDYIPKDSDHVIDITLTLQFGAYSGQ